MPSDGLRRGLGVVLVAVAYWLAARVGLAFAHGGVSPVWPATGLAIGALVVWGRWLWPGIFLGTLAAHLEAPGHLPSGLLVAAGSAAGAFLGAWAVERACGGADAFDRPTTTGRFVFWAAVVTPLVSSLVGVTAFAAWGLEPWSRWPSLWVTWYVADGVGALLVAPAVILLPRLRFPSGLRWWEGPAFVAVVAAVGLLAFGPLRPPAFEDVRLGTLSLPVVVWAAARFGPLVSSWTVLSFSGMSLGGTLDGDLLVRPHDATLALLELQGLLALLALSGLFTAAVVQERRSAYVALASARDLLEATVEERTRRLQSAMADLHEAQELAGLGRWQFNDRSGLFSGSPWLHRTFDVGTAAPLDRWTRSMPRADAVEWTTRMREAMAAGRPFTLGVRLRLGGETKHLQFTGAPLPGRGWHGTCQDVTRAREAAGTAQRLAVLVQTSPYAIIAADAEGAIDTWNEAAVALFGYRADEALGMHLDRIVPHEDRADMAALRQRVMRSREVVEMDCERVHRDGHLIPVHLTLAPVDDPQHGGPRLTAIMRDRRPELEAAETDAMLRAVVESAPVAIITLSPDGEILTWNHAAQRLYGHPAGDVLGRSITTLAPDGEAPTAVHADALARGHVVGEAQVEHLRADGERVPVGLTLAPIRDDAGRLRLVSCLARDLRPEQEARRMADEARRIENELEALDELTRLKTEFINMASHELRTPLTPIRVQLHLLKSADLDEAARLRAVGVIERNMVRLSLLVEDVFAAAKLQHDGFAVKASDTDLAALCQDVLTAFGGQAAQNRVRLDLRTRGDVHLKADPDRVTQVLFNLVSNALKHAPPDSVVHVEATGRSEDVVLAVEDEGAGIPEDQRAVLFQPFGRLERPDAKPGTGLGLYICKGIAELHGGRIDVAQSRHRSGARFEVSLPRRPKAPADEALEPAAG